MVLTLIAESIKYLVDLPNRCEVGKIGTISPQDRPGLRDYPVVAVPGFKIETSNADIGCRLISPAGDSLFDIGFDETERQQVLFYEIHIFAIHGVIYPMNRRIIQGDGVSREKNRCRVLISDYKAIGSTLEKDFIGDVRQQQKLYCALKQED